MRPLELSIDGLTCFRERQVVDFGELELFCISGPTGAGKSSLLDAMLFALYGEIPRVDKHGVKELISSSRDRMSVRLDFETGEDRYRITRTIRRKGNATVRLEKHDGTDYTIPLADKIGEARTEIAGILGLDAEAFTQAVILPQGQFAKFLKSPPAERRRMLRALLRLEVYETMRARAEQEAKARRDDLEATRRVLEREYEGVNEKAVTEAEKEHRAVERTITSCRKKRDAAKKKAERLRQKREKTVELEKAVERREKLESAKDSVAAARRQIARSEAAARLRPILDHAERARSERDAARTEAESASEALAIARSAHADAASRLEAAKAPAAEIPGLRESMSRLDQVAGRLPERDGLRASLEAKSAELESAKVEEARLVESRTELESSRKELEAEHTQAESRAASEPYAPEVHAMLAEARSIASGLGATRENHARLSESFAKKEAEVAAAKADLGAKSEAAATAEESLREAEVRAARADEAVAAGLQSDAAMQLRRTLEPGEACPVCEQTVDKVPRARAKAKLTALEREAKAAAKAKDAARHTSEASRTAAAAQHAVVDGLEEALADLASRVKVGEEEIVRLESEIRSELGSAAEASLAAFEQASAGSGTPIETGIESAYRASEDSRASYEEAREAARSTEREIERIASELSKIDVELDASKRSTSRIEREITSDRERLERIETEVSGVTDATDPATERERLAERIEGLERELEGATEAEASERSRLAAAEEQASAQATRFTEATAEAERRESESATALAEAGFSKAEDLTSLEADGDELAELAELVERHDRDLHAIADRIATLEGELGRARVGEDELVAVEQELSELDDEIERSMARRGELAEARDALRKQLDRSKTLRAEAEAKASTLGTYRHLATDLRSDRFQAYVLEEVFRDLVRGASERLFTLTGERYTLEFENEEIRVVDHDNAGETRISDTLSGGETFLTSLSLALELSDQVQRAAGAVHLDSLFIDEGFGTLDPDTLNCVSETIQGLPVGGRMVGIITHIPDLRDEFAQRVVVSRGTDGSSVEVRARVE